MVPTQMVPTQMVPVYITHGTNTLAWSLPHMVLTFMVPTNMAQPILSLHTWSQQTMSLNTWSQHTGPYTDRWFWRTWALKTWSPTHFQYLFRSFSTHYKEQLIVPWNEILARIQMRIRVCRSIPLTNDPDADPNPAVFVSDLQDVNKKLFFCLKLFEGTFSSFFKDEKVTKKSQNSENNVFLTIFSWR